MLPVKVWWPTTRDFFRDVWSEMKKVSWPTRAELRSATGVVIVAVFVVAIIIGLIDLAFTNILKLVIR